MQKSIYLALLWSFTVFGVKTPTALGPFEAGREGMFDIQMECQDPFPSEECKEVTRYAKLFIINIGSTISVAVGYPETSVPRFLFLARELKEGGLFLRGNNFEVDDSSGTANPATVNPAEFLLELTETEHGYSVNGWIRDANFTRDIHVSGTQVFSPGSLFWKEPASQPLLTQTFVGQFLAASNDRVWLLTIRNGTSNGKLFIADAKDMGDMTGTYPPSGIKIKFTSVQWHPDRGVLGLVAPTSLSGAYVKWTLGVDPGETEGNNLHGYLLSSFGRGVKLRIQRITTGP